jgi:hypothetical protein
METTQNREQKRFANMSAVIITINAYRKKRKYSYVSEKVKTQCRKTRKRKSYNNQRKKIFLPSREPKIESDSYKIFFKEKKSFQSRLFSQCVSRKI